MKKKFNVLYKRSCLIFCCLVLSFKAFAGDPEWYANDHFKISKNDEEVKVSMKKLPYESFSVNLSALNPSGEVISFGVKSEKKITLRVDGFTSEGTQIHLFNEEIEAGSFEKLYYNINQSEHSINHLIFYVNPGQKYEGELIFKELKVSSALEVGKTLSLFPNPTSDVINIRLPGKQFESIAIYDLYGMLILEKLVESSSIEVDLKGQKTGIYILKAKGPNATLTQRFMVK
jgi:hypothetical protein